MAKMQHRGSGPDPVREAVPAAGKEAVHDRLPPVLERACLWVRFTSV
ncbi:hypothetical protein [Shimazuella alba]|uniref:Uncharacterized protein n=1 Tax=Shimazuella alba TaxID=2690964 RepID=A0A6I4VSQ7_9BACL|nr:hypothetical protein [Shimazuella alba]MXQ52850.1 hypothetical protein [Shimazuella alba]